MAWTLLAGALLASAAARAQTPADRIFASGFQLPDLPAWYLGMAVGQWQPIPGSALSSAPIAVHTYPGVGGSGPQAKTDAWSGFALDTRDAALYSPANGGHNDYAGNEVDRIRLLDDAPAWTEPRTSTPLAQITAGGSHYADGRPV